MWIKTNPKRKVIDKANHLIKYLYNTGVNQVRKKELTTDEQFALLDYEQKLRSITKELIDKFRPK